MNRPGLVIAWRSLLGKELLGIRRESLLFLFSVCVILKFVVALRLMLDMLIFLEGV